MDNRQIFYYNIIMGNIMHYDLCKMPLLTLMNVGTYKNCRTRVSIKHFNYNFARFILSSRDCLARMHKWKLNAGQS